MATNTQQCPVCEGTGYTYPNGDKLNCYHCGGTGEIPKTSKK